MLVSVWQISFFVALVAAVVFLGLFFRSRRLYRNLLKKNLQEQNFVYPLYDKVDFAGVKTETSQDLAVIRQLQTLFESDKIYLSPDLTVGSLARTMGIARGTLSRVVNHYFHKNFPALLNQYRINESLHLLTDATSRNWTLEVIGEKCGYRNRQLFHSAFKKETGITPNQFRKIAGM